MGYNFANEIVGDSILSQYKKGEKITITARINRSCFENRDTGFYIYECETSDYHRFTVLGTFIAPLVLDNFYEFTGKVNKKEDWQLQIISCKSVMPTNKEDIITVLRTLNGLDTKAYAVYDILGNTALSDIRDSPEIVASKIRGLGLQRALTWQEQLLGTEQLNEVTQVLSIYNISAAKAKTLYDKYGYSICQEIRNNPYFLANEAGVISFGDCDEIALKNGYTPDGIERIEGAMLYTLKDAANNEGHCYLPEDIFLQRVHNVLDIVIKYREAIQILNNPEDSNRAVNISDLKLAITEWKKKNKTGTFSYPICKLTLSKLEQVLQKVLVSDKICKDEIASIPVYYLHRYYDAEKSVAAYIRNIQNAAMPLKEDNESYIAEYCDNNEIYLENKQMDAVRMFTKNKGGLYIMNGAAGCGKTFTLRTILGVLSNLYKAEGCFLSTKILAPTGKAAKVAHDATGLPAATIHKELGLMQSDSNKPLNIIDADCLVIDEFSMTDIILAEKLFSAVKPTTKVIILGDTEQLPSIGAGMVLHDMINSGCVNVVTLDVVRRQSQQSGILINATRIIHGEVVEQELPDDIGIDNNAYLTYTDSVFDCQNEILNTIKYLVEDEMLDIDDIQVLCPQKKTEIGTEILNLLIQKAINPGFSPDRAAPAMEITYMQGSGKEVTETLYFKKGDKVIHTQNNYQMAWYTLDNTGSLVQDYLRQGIINGETGIVQDVQVSKNANGINNYKVLVRYNDGFVLYQNDFSELQHAYAMTIHKSQGSQWKIVLSPVMTCNSRMLNRKMLYTMYTRAQKTIFCFGDKKAIEKAVVNNPQAQRYTSLSYRIQNH